MNTPLVTTMFVALLLSGCATMQTAMSTASLIQQGRYSEAERVVEAATPDPSAATAMQISQVCSIYTFTKNYGKLFPCLDLYQSKIDNGEGMTYMPPDPHRMRAMALLDLGNYDGTIAEANKCMDALQPLLHKMHVNAQMSWYAQFECLSAKGLAYALEKNFPAAHKTIQELLDIGEAGMQAEYRSLMIARIYLSMGEYRKGLELLRRRVGEHSKLKQGLVKPAYAQFEEEAAADGPLQGSLTNPIVMKIPQLYTVSKLLLESGETDLAKKGLDNILTVPQLSQIGFMAWYIYADRGRIAEMDRDYAAAIVFYRHAADIIESQRATIGNDAGKIGFVGDKQVVYRGLVHSLMALGRTAEAFEYVEHAKARALVDMLAQRTDFAPSAGSVAQTRNLIVRLQKAEKSAAEMGTPAEESNRRSVVVEVRNEIRSLDPQLASLVSVEGTSTESITNGLGSDETLIEYYYYGDEMYVFVLTPYGITGVQLDDAGLESAVRDFRSAVQDPLSDDYIATGRRLHDMLIRPIADQLRTQNLVIVPHGILHYVPFAALRSDRDFLIDTYAISVLPSASVRQFLHPHTASGGIHSLLVFGNPDLGNPAYDLHFAENEARAVGALVPGSAVLLGKDASESEFRAVAQNFSALHFATHGRFDAAKPLTSGLLLAADHNQDGVVTAGELYGLRLRANLVTLSACETALGTIANGDDVVGLTRGFLFAGVNSIVSSLWQVDDRATAVLMRDFYTDLNSADTRTALREAQLDIKSGDYPQPFYWAPFELAGSPQ